MFSFHHIVGDASHRQSEGEAEFDECHVSTEQINVWDEQQKMVSSRFTHGQLDVLDRKFACQLIWGLANSTKQLNRELAAQPAFCWLEALQLFDISSCDLVNAPQSKIANRAVAVCHACLKLETQSWSALKFMREHLVAWSTHFSASPGDGAVVESSFDIEERQFSLKLASGLLMPTSLKWLDTFWARFNVVTRGRFRPAISVAQSLSSSWAKTSAWSSAVSAEMPPRIVAQGLCCAVLITMRVLSRESFRPCYVERQKWDQLCGSVASISQVLPWPVVGPPELLNSALMLALNRDLDALQSSAFVVMGNLHRTLAP